MKTQTAFDLKRMALLTGVPVFALKEALGIPLEECTAKTLDEVKHLYFNSPPSDDDEENKEGARSIVKKWEELSLAEANAAITKEEVVAALENVVGAKARAVALKKMLGFLTSRSEIEDLYKSEPEYNKEAHPLILEKLLSLATNAEEAESVYNVARARASRKEEALVYSKWEQLSLEEIGRANTPELAHAAWTASPHKSGVETLALNKLEQLCRKEIESATTPETIADLLAYIPEESELRSVALIKIAVLLGYTG